MSPIALRLSVMMFLQFFVWGAWYVSLNPYMKAHDMTLRIGDAYTVGPLAAILSPFFLGIIADRYFSTERALGAMHVLGGVIILFAPWAATQSAGLFVGVLLGHMLCYMPTLGLSNTLAFHNIQDQEKEFPVIRVFGTIGWIAANTVVSKVFSADTLDLQFQIAGGASILLGVYSFTLPNTPPPAAGKEFSVREILGLDSLALLKQLPFLVFMVCSFLICIPLAAYYAYAGGFVGAAGFKEVAFTMSFGQWSEIGFMLVMPLFFRRLGVKWMLAFGMLAWVVRYGLFALGAPDSVSWMILTGVVLHGICYDFFFVTGQIYVDKKADPGIRGQAQGFLVLVTQGLGMLIGAQVSGALFNDIVGEDGTLLDYKQFWTLPCAAALVVLVAFVALFNDRAVETAIEQDEAPDEGDVAKAAVETEQP